ncbi:MAG TPA: cysteine desulfurase family protein [Candidatus Eisenbacteria bacterium]|nr:cysteine desulfurase family protein [Candidatus Eisenbacteria bacterium]
MSRAVYLDHNATTPVHPRALEAMRPYLEAEFGNPSSATHVWGHRARKAVEEARAAVADLLGARPTEIVFTSGATESNNLALKGCARARRGRGRHLITTAIEHDSVTQALRHLETEGFELTLIAPDRHGCVHAEDIARGVRHDTVLVSVGAVNGELGTVQPFDEIASSCAKHGIAFHSDATQAVGKIPLDVREIGIDLLSLSSHKLYGPKGVGALYVREGVSIEPLFHGGGQERGLRSGTLNVPGIVGLGAAARIRKEEMEDEAKRLGALREALWAGIRRICPDARQNGDAAPRIYGTLNVAFPRIPSDRLLESLPQFALSAGSACHSGTHAPSPVLTAIGLEEDLASCSIRFGLGRGTTAEEVEALLLALEKVVRRVRGPAHAKASTAVRYD